MLSFLDEKPTLKKLQYMSYTSEDGSTVKFRLMDQIKPRVARLAAALSFPQHIIANLKTESDPVFYLFSEWLRGANKKHDPRPLTWRTLINGLDEAGLLEEVEILEEKIIIEPPVVDRRGMPKCSWKCLKNYTKIGLTHSKCMVVTQAIITVSLTSFDKPFFNQFCLHHA